MTKLVASSIRFLAPRRRRVVLLIAGLALIGFIVSHATTHLTAAESAAAAPVMPPAPKVTVAPVEEKLVTEYEELTGHIDATETVELRARVSGHVDAVHFQAGQLVHKGDA